MNEAWPRNLTPGPLPLRHWDPADAACLTLQDAAYPRGMWGRPARHLRARGSAFALMILLR